MAIGPIQGEWPHMLFTTLLCKILAHSSFVDGFQADLMRKSVRLSSLHAIWCSALPLSRTSREQAYEYASKVVHIQIGLVVSRGMVDLEVEILSTLQKLIFNSKGPGKGNMLSIWICLWLLILTYRRSIQNFESKIKMKSEMALAKHMYDLFVSVYSGLFRPSSPMWLNWLKDDIFELFGNDTSITHCVGTLKTELDYICMSFIVIPINCLLTLTNVGNSDEDFQCSYDSLLRSLVFENEKKLGRKAHEAALKSSLSGWTYRTSSESHRLLDVMVHRFS